MKGPILILPLASGVYLAKNDRGLSAEGGSPVDAIHRLEAVTAEWVKQYQQAVVIPAANPNPNWAGWTGSLSVDDPIFKEWQAAVAEYRAAKDAEDAATP